MATTIAITAEILPLEHEVVTGYEVPRIRIDVTITEPNEVKSWQVSRAVAGQGKQLLYYSDKANTPTTLFLSLIDDTAPLDVDIEYWLETISMGIGGDYEISNTVRITGTIGCFLTNVRVGTTLPVELYTWPNRDRTARQSVLEVLSRPDPVGLTDVHTTPVGVWTLLTHTDIARDALIALLTTGAVVLLRTQPTSSIPTVTALVGDIRERRYSNSGTDQRRLHDVKIQEIAPQPGTSLPLAATLGGLAVYDGDTLLELSQLRFSLLQLSQIETG